MSKNWANPPIPTKDWQNDISEKAEAHRAEQIRILAERRANFDRGDGVHANGILHAFQLGDYDVDGFIEQDAAHAWCVKNCTGSWMNFDDDCENVYAFEKKEDCAAFAAWKAGKEPAA